MVMIGRKTNPRGLMMGHALWTKIARPLVQIRLILIIPKRSTGPVSSVQSARMPDRKYVSVKSTLHLFFFVIHVQMAKAGDSMSAWKIATIVLACVVGLSLLASIGVWALWWPSCADGITSADPDVYPPCVHQDGNIKNTQHCICGDGDSTGPQTRNVCASDLPYCCGSKDSCSQNPQTDC